LPGQSVQLTVVRDNSTIDMTVVLGQRPPPPV
jgi:S1-C subfamily serine protease